MNRIILSIATIMLLASCGANDQSQEVSTEKPSEKVEQACKYNYNADETEVLWVAYKYTQKTGVKGVFDDVQVEGVVEAAHPAEVIANASFSINTSSVNSGDPTRDPKIQNTFFGSMIDGQSLTGKVVSVSGDDSKGTIQFMLLMNGIEHSIDGEYTVIDDKMEVKANITVADWNASDAIAALNKVCEDLHKGADGTSILWPEVSLFISTKLNKTCE